jgi:hypothetical protein
MNPQFLLPPDIAATAEPLRAIGATLILTVLVVVGLTFVTPSPVDRAADSVALALR